MNDVVEYCYFFTKHSRFDFSGDCR